MDDDRPIQPDDIDAFFDRVRPQAGRLLRLATIAAGDRAAGELAASVAVRAAWRDACRLPAENLSGALEARLAAALPRARPAAGGTALDRALAPLGRADWIALARCLDPDPDGAAVAVAGRVGVETAARADGEIVDLNGPLAGWDLARLRAALAAAAGQPDPDRVMEQLHAQLAGVRPEAAWRVAVRASLPTAPAALRVGGLVFAALLGVGVLAWGGAAIGGERSPAGGTGTDPGVVTSSRARTPDRPGLAALFPKRVDGALVRSVADALALAEAGMPAGATIAVAGWLASPVLAGSCLAEARGVKGPRNAGAAFCRRGMVLRGSTTNGRALHLQLPPGTPELPIDDAMDARRMPVPVVALVESGSPRSEPCWPTDDGCGRELVLERLLWVDGAATSVAFAELDAEGVAPPRLSVAEVRRLAETAIADRGRVVSVIRVPAAQRGEVAPGADDNPVAGDHAWIVRIRSPMVGTGTDPETRLDLLWWFMVDDATGRTSTGSRSIAALPGRVAGPVPG